MPRQANGTFLPPANTAAVTATTISSTAYNSLETDIGTEITNSLDRLGRSAMQAALPMGGQKITGMADPTVATDGATKNYVDTTAAAFFSTGDMKPTFSLSPLTGWLLMNDGYTIGNVSSGATTAAVICQALFTLLWNNCADAACPVSGGRGASAAADWAGNKTLRLPSTSGRTFAGYAGGSRALGSIYGAETTTITQAQLPNVGLSVSASGSSSVSSTVGNIVTASINTNAFNYGTGAGSFGVLLTINTGASGAISSTGSASVTGSTSSINGGTTQTALTINQPTTVVVWMIKL